jgi:Mg-chelatase subunit ChlD
MDRIRTIITATVILLLVQSYEAQDKSQTNHSRRPVSYGIVVDNSGSYRLLLERVINLTHAIAEENVEGDETFLVTFVDAAKTRLRLEMTSDKQEIREALDNMFVEGGTSAVLDATRLAIDYLAANVKEKEGREQALLLISDGDDGSSTAKLESVVSAAKENKIRIVVIGISDEKLNTKLLDRLSKGTGGVAFFPKNPKETLAIAGEVAEAIRAN